jgi:amidohydrolase
MKWMDRANSVSQQLVSWRRDLHMYPELGLDLVRTAGVVEAELGRLGYHLQTGIAKTGIVAWLTSDRPGPCLLLRFDMDGLPLQEENDIPYKSRHPGLMHACGHDGHVAIGLGVATLLARHQAEWSGSVKLMFQPGEEGLNGADVMVQEGAVDRIGPAADMALALHLWNELPVGQVSAVTGPVMASAESWECIIQGQGAHGAAPHLGIDPMVAAAQMILAWQTVISRNVNPQQAAVLSVGSVHAGEAFNIIPDRVTLRGTLRCFDEPVRQLLLRRVREIAQGIGTTMGCSVSLHLDPLSPTLVNDPRAVALVRRAAAELVGEDNIVHMRTMGSEDMAFVHRVIPGCYAFVGSRNAAAGLVHGHHNPRFDFDEAAMPLAVALLTAAAADFMGAN